MRGVILLFFTLLASSSDAQIKMRPVEELINNGESAWALVKTWIDTSKNKVEILPADTTKSKIALFNTQVTTRSPMGAIIYTTGGLIVDNGWIRILGSGHAKLTRTIPDWNKGKSFKDFGERPSFLLIADDAIGGLFAINGGQFGDDAGKIYYQSPGSLKWESLEMTYTEFLFFCFYDDLDEFYAGYRWPDWKSDLSKLNGDQVFNFVPPLWSKQGKDITKNEKMAISIEEQYQFNTQIRKQLGLE